MVPIPSYYIVSKRQLREISVERYSRTLSSNELQQYLATRVGLWNPQRSFNGISQPLKIFGLVGG